MNYHLVNLVQYLLVQFLLQVNTMEDEKDKKKDIKEEKDKNFDSSKITSEDYKNLFGTPPR